MMSPAARVTLDWVQGREVDHEATTGRRRKVREQESFASSSQLPISCINPFHPLFIAFHVWMMDSCESPVSCVDLLL